MRPFQRVRAILSLLVVVGLSLGVGGRTSSAADLGHVAAFGGANGQILFLEYHDLGAFMTMNPDGTGRSVLPGSRIEDWEPSFSAGGGRIAYIGVGNLFDVFVMRADGSHLHDLTNQDGDEGSPTWAPDGSMVAYTHGPRGGPWDVWVISADGTGAHSITGRPGDNLAPAWAPDGARIAFMSNRTGNWDVYSMKPDGSDRIRLTSDHADDGCGPGIRCRIDWSPDSSRIAFASNRDGNWELYTMNADGSNQTRLTRAVAADTDPKWSPDGEKFAFVSTRSGTEAIYTRDVAHGPATRLTPEGGRDIDPAWQPVPVVDTNVEVGDSGMSPLDLKSRLGWTVGWSFTGIVSHAVADPSGLALFGSGPEPTGGAYAATFFGAGSYGVIDPVSLATGTISVSPTAEPPSGPPGTTFTVTWSSQAPPSGFTFDVQAKPPGSSTWMPFLTDTTQTSATTTPLTPGRYHFRARLGRDQVKSGWSPRAAFDVN